MLFCVTLVLFFLRAGDVMMDPNTHGNSQSDIICIIGSWKLHFNAELAGIIYITCHSHSIEPDVYSRLTETADGRRNSALRQELEDTRSKHTLTGHEINVILLP